MRLKLRNVRTGDIIERTFKSGEKFREVEMFRKKTQFLYTDTDKAHFMDLESFETISMPINEDHECSLENGAEIMYIVAMGKTKLL